MDSEMEDAPEQPPPAPQQPPPAPQPPPPAPRRRFTSPPRQYSRREGRPESAMAASSAAVGPCHSTTHAFEASSSRPTEASSSRPFSPSRVILRVRKLNGDDLPTLCPHGLAAWLVLKLYWERTIAGFEIPDVNIEEEDTCIASLITPEKVYRKTDEEFNVTWLEEYANLDAICQTNIESFATQKSYFYEKLRVMQLAIAQGGDLDGHQFDELFSGLARLLGHGAYIFNDRMFSYSSTVDAMFASLAIIISRSLTNSSLHQKLMAYINICAYVDRIVSKYTGIKVIDFSNQLTQMGITSRADFLALIQVKSEEGASSSDLGAGTYGTVIKCNIKGDNPFQLPVGEHAIKFFRGRSSTSSMCHYFQEAFFSLSLNHERFTTRIARGTNDNGLHCLVLSLAEGGDVRAFVRGSRSNIEPNRIDFILSILRDIAYGLHILHTSSPIYLVHGDLTPQNVFIHHGRALLADFGKLNLQGSEMDRGSFMDDHGSTTIERKYDIYGFGRIMMMLLSGEDNDAQIEGRYWQRHQELKSKMINLGWSSSKAERLLQLPLRCIDQDRDKRPYPLDIVQELMGSD